MLGTRRRIAQFNRLFFRPRPASARNHRIIYHGRTARPSAIRPHRQRTCSQGIPGIFSHFLRNYR
ncbi:hypothetical protein PL79_001025 [Burkholderia sp. USMB20]|nr:hypothetical protein PL79_001025 [Burkholderia sp. USMB20]